MRQLFFLIITLLVLQMFYPLVSDALSSTLLSFINLMGGIFDQANIQLENGFGP